MSCCPKVASEQELKQFLGDISEGVAKAVGGAINSPIGKALGGVLKNVAKTALPVVGGALGSFVAPGFGTAIGSKLGSMAGNLLEQEDGEINAEQADFEVARRVVRLSATAAQRAAMAPPHVAPRQVARTSVLQAARQVLPGAVRTPAGAQWAGYGWGPQGLRHLRSAPSERTPLAGVSPAFGRAPALGALCRWLHTHQGSYGSPRRRGQDGSDSLRCASPPHRLWLVWLRLRLGPGRGLRRGAALWRRSGSGRPGESVERGATGRWVRRGRKIILLGV